MLLTFQKVMMIDKYMKIKLSITRITFSIKLCKAVNSICQDTNSDLYREQHLISHMRVINKQAFISVLYFIRNKNISVWVSTTMTLEND